MVKSLQTLILALLALKVAHSLPSQSYVRPNAEENIKRLNNLGPDDLAEELSGQFQGDMVMSPEEIEMLLNGRGGRTGLIDTRYRWTNNIVPYTIREEDFTSAQIHYIHLGAERLNEVSCLRFVPYNPAVHENYIWVTGERSGCWSYVGMLGRGRQQLNLQPNTIEVGCFRLGTVIHEYLHAVGFYHMQSATERDDYVRIVWENIQAGTERNFDIYNSSVISNFDVEYDYGSVMHYSRTAFSINGSDTIVAIRDLGDNIMGQRVRVSDKDITRLNRMYCPQPVRPPPAQSLSEFFERINTSMNRMFRAIFSKFN